MNGARLLSRSAALARLTKKQYDWADAYSGAITDLIAAGVVLSTQIPGLPGNRKLQATYLADGSLASKGGRGGVYALRVSLRGHGHAEVLMPVDAAEKYRRCQDRQRRNPQVLAAPIVPPTPDEIARKQQAEVACWQRTIDMTWRMASGGENFRLSERDQARFLEALRTASAILNTATIVNVEQQQSALGVARKDDTFQQFMLDQGLRGLSA